MSVFLKVKIKSLAEEARIIKREEDKRKVWRGGQWNVGTHATEKNKNGARMMRTEQKEGSKYYRERPWYGKSAEELHQLHLHRINVVRKEARLTHIAYAMVRGRVVHDHMDGLKEEDHKRIHNMVKKYGGATTGTSTGILTPRAAGSNPATASIQSAQLG